MADRYTVLERNFDEISESINHAESLGLQWFAQKNPVSRRSVRFFVFFDEDGMGKYLSMQWGNDLDKVAEWVEELKANQITDIVFGQRCMELFGGDST